MDTPATGVIGPKLPGKGRPHKLLITLVVACQLVTFQLPLHETTQACVADVLKGEIGLISTRILLNSKISQFPGVEHMGGPNSFTFRL